MESVKVNLGIVRMKRGYYFYFLYRNMFWGFDLKAEYHPRPDFKFNGADHVELEAVEYASEEDCLIRQENFKKADIKYNEQVAVLYQEDGSVIAIAKKGEDMWLDVRDNLTPKTFEELNVSITSLKAFWK